MLGMNRSDYLAAHLPIDPSKSLPENIAEILHTFPFLFNGTGDIAAVLPFNDSAMTLTNLPFAIADLLPPLPPNITHSMLDLVSAIGDLLPSNETDDIDRVISDAISHPIHALGDAFDAILPPDMALDAGDFFDSLSNSVAQVTSDFGLTQLLVQMLEMTGEDMSKSLAELLASEGAHGVVADVIGSMLPVETTQSLASLLSLDTNLPMALMAFDMMEDMLRCVQTMM